jgi:hypothetical protein
MNPVMRIQIEPHADLKAAPRSLYRGGSRIDIMEIVDQWYGPGYRYVKVRAYDDSVYILLFDEIRDQWEPDHVLRGAGAGVATQVSWPRSFSPVSSMSRSSLAQQPIDFDDVMLTRGYTGGRAYAQSKLAQIMFRLTESDRPRLWVATRKKSGLLVRIAVDIAAGLPHSPSLWSWSSSVLSFLFII